MKDGSLILTVLSNERTNDWQYCCQIIGDLKTFDVREETHGMLFSHEVFYSCFEVL